MGTAGKNGILVMVDFPLELLQSVQWRCCLSSQQLCYTSGINDGTAIDLQVRLDCDLVEIVVLSGTCYLCPSYSSEVWQMVQKR